MALVFTAACGGPTSPGNVTEARVVSDTTWAGTLGERGSMSGNGSSDVLNIGSGRECATVRRTGNGFLTLRVGGDSDTTPAGAAGLNVNVTVCGDGVLR